MLIIVLTALLSVILAMVLYKEIHQYKLYLYLSAAILAFIAHEDGNIITLGYVPFGLFLTVMFSGALDKGIIRKRLFMVRAEYSILATIFLLPHALGYMERYLDVTFPELSSVSQMFGVMAFTIVVPLFITSFQTIRKKFTYKQWKLLHKAAYFMYGFVFIHLLLLQNDRFYFYLIITVAYFGLKIPEFIKYLNTKIIKKETA